MNPFTDSAFTHALYDDAARMQRRTGALHAAKTAGPAVADTIAALDADGPHDVVLDVGCGRGTTTAALARLWAPRVLIALDLSASLLREARSRVDERAPAHAACVRYRCSDFHALPCPNDSVDVAVAAFCLYHAPDPTPVLRELKRCLRPEGRVVLVTKSADSYRDLDNLLAATGIDSRAPHRPSLYESFHSTNAVAQTVRQLRVTKVVHHQHRFRFTDPHNLASYLATTPRYTLPTTDTTALGEALAPHIGAGINASSTVTYLVATAS